MTEEEMKAEVKKATVAAEAIKEELKNKDTRITELTSQLDKDNKDIIEKRDKAKEAERAALIAEGKASEALESLTKQYAEYKELYNEDVFKPIKEKSELYDSYIETEKKELIEKLPEDLRDTFKDLGVDKIKTLVKTFEDTNVGTDRSKNNKIKKNSGNNDQLWAEMSPAERDELTEKDQELANKKIKEYITNKKNK